jgi:hypothetical protein
MVALSKGPCFTFGAKGLGGVHSEERAALLRKLIFYLSDFFLYIIIIISILLIIIVIKEKILIYEWQRTIASDAEQTRHCLWHLCVDASLSVTSLCRRATGSGVFS